MDARPRIAVLFNPVAGSPKRRRALARAIRELRRSQCRATLRYTTGPGDAIARTEAVARAGTFDAVMVAGGDGTVREAAQGLASSGVARLPALAVLPLGTANVLAQELDLPLDPVAAARVAAGLRTIEVPLAVADGRHFLLMVGAGFDAHVVKNVRFETKRRWGKLAYVAEMMRELFRFHFRRYRATVDGNGHDAASVVVSRGRFYGGRFLLVPDARLQSPTLHVCLFGTGGRTGAVIYAIALGLGLLPSSPGFRVIKATRVRIEGPLGDGASSSPAQDEPVQADGDNFATLPIDIAMTERSLRLVVP